MVAMTARLSNQIRVLVIGAGSSGIAAANHLRNYGHTVRERESVCVLLNEWYLLCI